MQCEYLNMQETDDIYTRKICKHAWKYVDHLINTNLMHRILSDSYLMILLQLLLLSTVQNLQLLKSKNLKEIFVQICSCS